MQDLVSLLKARAHKRTQMSGTSYLTTHRTAHAVCPANTPYAGSSLCIRRLASMLCSAGASELSKIGQSPRNHNVFQSVATKSATLSFSHNLRPRIPQKQHYLFWFELSDVTVSRGQYPPARYRCSPPRGSGYLYRTNDKSCGRTGNSQRNWLLNHHSVTEKLKTNRPQNFCEQVRLVVL